MKIIKWIKNHKVLIIIGVGIIIVFFIININSKNTQTKTEGFDQTRNDQKNSSDTVKLKDKLSPTQVGELLPTEKPENFNITDSDPLYPLKQYLPYKGNGFVVDSYIAPLVIVVKVKNKSDIPNVQPLLKRWLLENEITPGENKITWKYGE